MHESLLIVLVAVFWAGAAASTPPIEPHNHNLCLASATNHPRVNGYHYYPIDQFESSVYKEVVSDPHQKNDDKLYNCMVDLAAPNNYSHCPSFHSFCPVHHQNILDAVNRTSAWMYPSPSSAPYLLKFWERLGNSETSMNVIIFGGSATIGADSTGCQCNAEIDSKCAANTKYAESHADFTLIKKCRWSNPFMRWLRSISSAELRLKFRAVSATSSKYLSQNLDYINSHDTFSDNDLILIDYSMNDALSFSSKLQVGVMRLGLERLIRGIYERSPNSYPTIILLETWPWNGNVKRDPQTAPEMFDYRVVYGQLAQHYHLPLWSYKDFLWSSYASTQQSDYISYLRYMEHPQWPQHLHIADTLAAIMWMELLRCSFYDGSSVTQPDKWPLPSPISAHDDSDFCDSSMPVVLEVHARDVFASATQQTPWVRTLPVGESTSWKLYEDRPGKAGWIDEYPADTEQNEDNPVHSIVFVVPPERMDTFMTPNKQAVVQISYMRTYSNAGEMDLFLCGEPYTVPYIPNGDLGDRGHLDALWDTPVSIVEVFSLSFPSSRESLRCAIQVDQPDSLMQQLGLNSSYIMISHYHSRLADPKILRKRTVNQKVKVTGIKICMH